MDGAVRQMSYFHPHVDGLEKIVAGEETGGGFAYYPDGGLSIVLHGPAGSGKTLFALQCAMAAIYEGHNVIYLTKDTSPRTLLTRIGEVFHCFDLFTKIKKHVRRKKEEEEEILKAIKGARQKDLEDQAKYRETWCLVPDESTEDNTNSTIFASSSESVGKFRFWKCAQRMKQGDFKHFIASEAVGFSRD